MNDNSDIYDFLNNISLYQPRITDDDYLRMIKKLMKFLGLELDIIFENKDLSFHLNCLCKKQISKNYMSILFYLLQEVFFQIEYQTLEISTLRQNVKDMEEKLFFYKYDIDTKMALMTQKILDIFLEYLYNQIEKYYNKYIEKNKQYFSIKLQNIFMVVLKILIINLAYFNFDCKNIKDNIYDKLDIPIKQCNKNENTCEDCTLIDTAMCKFHDTIKQDNIHIILLSEYNYLGLDLILLFKFIKQYHKSHNELKIIIDFKYLNENFTCKKETLAIFHYITQNFKNIIFINYEDKKEMVQNIKNLFLDKYNIHLFEGE